MWTECYDMLPFRTLNLVNNFKKDPWSKRMKCRFGSHTAPKGKMTKHRKFIQKMARV